MTIKLHFESQGHGEPVLILHGLFGSGSNWKSFARKLADDFHVITVDLRNHGKSAHSQTMTYREMAMDIQHIMGKLDIREISLIGHSMGGKAAMVYSLICSQMLDRLIVLDIAPVQYKNTINSLLENLEELPLNKLSGRKEADKLLSGKIPFTSLRLFLLQNLVQDDKHYRWRFNLESIKQNTDELSGFPELDSSEPYHGPALFIAGTESPYIREEHLPAINKYFPRAEIHYINNAGHWLHIDQPEKLLEKIRSFLQPGQ